MFGNKNLGGGHSFSGGFGANKPTTLPSLASAQPAIPGLQGSPSMSVPSQNMGAQPSYGMPNMSLPPQGPMDMGLGSVGATVQQPYGMPPTPPGLSNPQAMARNPQIDRLLGMQRGMGRQGGPAQKGPNGMPNSQMMNDIMMMVQQRGGLGGGR